MKRKKYKQANFLFRRLVNANQFFLIIMRYEYHTMKQRHMNQKPVYLPSIISSLSQTPHFIIEYLSSYSQHNFFDQDHPMLQRFMLDISV